MPGAGAFNIGGQNADRRQVAKPDISPGAERARQGALQRAREGDQLDLREAMNTLIAIGDLIPAADYHDRDDEPDLPDEEQAEIDNRDEDAPEPDEREEESYDRPEKPLKPSGNRPDECEAVENIKPFRILVEGDTCRFERPDWWGCEPVFKAGYSLVARTIARTFCATPIPGTLGFPRWRNSRLAGLRWCKRIFIFTRGWTASLTEVCSPGTSARPIWCSKMGGSCHSASSLKTRRAWLGSPKS